MNIEQAIKAVEKGYVAVGDALYIPDGNTALKHIILTALCEKQEREKGCVWCKEDNKVFHDGQHFNMFCSYCGKRLEVKQDEH